MPAHKTLAQVGMHLKSNGACMSALDWRANRLVDRGAKWAAEGVRLSPFTRRTLSGSLAAIESLVRLGYITWTVNNFTRWTIPDGGTVPVKTLHRDTDAHAQHRRCRKRAVERVGAEQASTTPDWRTNRHERVRSRAAFDALLARRMASGLLG